MTLIEFVNKYLNKKIDYDGVFDAQCMDVFRQYCDEVLDIPHTGSVEGAKDVWFEFSSNREHEFFDRYNVMQAKYGDVIIWDETPTNKYGHIAIFISFVSFIDGKILVFEQDGFKKDGCKLVIRDMKNSLGVLRKR